ncbi:hypothetical protein QYE76_056578 [Lolium multiflorum]|uniref:Uncharacterized protein n=1 Tax=Lolium multiflorum TaxID=4521 RepID=A0AAD8T2H8_LOLMU|nr:hypothetical protein QYE76_056578 [Lolium multiflorum]
MGESWASLGARVLTRVNSILVKGWHELVQGGERETFDTVWHAGDDQELDTSGAGGPECFFKDANGHFAVG